MAKITRLGGFTDATARGFVSPADVLRARGKLGPYDKPEADETEEGESCPGNSSETSPEKPPKTDAPSKPNRRRRARTTGARSGSGAGSGTAQTGTTSIPETDD